MVKTTLNINGMHCESCAKLIEMELNKEPGVTMVAVEYKNHLAVIEFEPKQTSVEKIIGIISSLGYQAREI